MQRGNYLSSLEKGMVFSKEVLFFNEPKNNTSKTMINKMIQRNRVYIRSKTPQHT